MPSTPAPSVVAAVAPAPGPPPACASDGPFTYRGASAGPAAQAARRQRLRELHRAAAFPLYGDDGRSAPGVDNEWRGALWHAQSLLEGDAHHRARANAMLRVAAPLHGGHFWNSAVSSILARCGAALDADVRAALADRLAQGLGDEAGQRFRGYNDNYPAMAALSMLVGGPAAGCDDHVDAGMACLVSAQRLLRRRGLLSEFNSPTYSPITLTCLAEIAELSPHAPARELARELEGCVWIDLAAHFHRPTGSVAGPFGRGYTVDLCGHANNAHTVLFLALGDEAFLSPLTLAFPFLDGAVRHNRTEQFYWSHVAWQSTPTYHVPDEAVELALHKPAAMTIHASAEQAAFPRNFWRPERHPRTPLAELAAGPMHTFTHLREDFALGVADRMFLDGLQATPLHVVYRRRRPARTLPDIGTLFSRFIIDDRTPRPDDHIPDEGRANAVAHHGSALVAYRPKPAWGCSALSPDCHVQPVRSLKLSLVVPCFWDRPLELWLGTKPASAWRGDNDEPCPVYLHDGALFAAIFPLALTRFSAGPAVRLEEHNGFGMVSFIHYDGPPRTFLDEELFTCHSGFAIELGSSADWPDFAAFRAAHAAPQIDDHWAAGDAMRLIRYERPGLSLALELSPISDGIKCRTVNDLPAPEPAFAATPR